MLVFDLSPEPLRRLGSYATLDGSPVSFTPIRIAEWGAPESALYPGLVAEQVPPFVQLTSADGAPGCLWANNLTITLTSEGRSQELLDLEQAAVAVTVTDARVAYACAQYDQGGGWAGISGGGALISLAANAISRSRAKQRSAGSCLVGHVRYEWLSAVGSSVKTRWPSHNYLLVTTMTSGMTQATALSFPPGTDSPFIAADIARRAARQRLAEGVAENEHAEWRRLSQAAPLPASDQGGWHCMPSWREVNE